ncbi:uncharacterized protein MCAP_0864-like [Argopecten irradians]|uniref:uncharacterized protein MCAP_0864-like n=1 Tax=Argopecten irradians TaxID=31199 RepID=UPI00371353B2
MGLEQLFWCTDRQMDACLLTEEISSKAETHLKYVEEEISKLQKLKMVIGEGVKVLDGTLCKGCINKLQSLKMTQSHASISTYTKMARLPEEQQKFVQDLEEFFIQKKMSKEGSTVDIQYVTTNEWYKQETVRLKSQHDREIKELKRERDNLKDEVRSLEVCNEELRDKQKQLQRTIGNCTVRIKTQEETIKLHENDRRENQDKIHRIESGLKNKDNLIAQLTGQKNDNSSQTEAKPETKICATQTEPKLETKVAATQTEPKPELKKEETKSSFFSFGSRKEDLKQLKETMADNQKLQFDLQLAREDLQKFKSKLQTKRDELAKTKSQLNENVTLIESIMAQNVESESRHLEEIKQRNETIQKQLDDIQRIEKSLKERECQLKYANSQMESLESEKKALAADLRKKTRELTTGQQQFDASRNEVKQSRHDLSEKELELLTLRKQLEVKQELKKKVIVLGLHCDRSGLGKSLVDMVVKELTKGVQDRLDRNNLNITIQFSQTPSEVNGWLKVVLCLNMSRVGTNIADVLRGMKGDRDVFVLVLHHTNKSNLSSLTPTSHRITGSDLRQLGGILDMAFGSESGLYECDLNSSAMDRIASVLKKYSLL